MGDVEVRISTQENPNAHLEISQNDWPKDDTFGLNQPDDTSVERVQHSTSTSSLYDYSSGEAEKITREIAVVSIDINHFDHTSAQAYGDYLERNGFELRYEYPGDNSLQLNYDAEHASVYIHSYPNSEQHQFDGRLVFSESVTDW